MSHVLAPSGQMIGIRVMLTTNQLIKIETKIVAYIIMGIKIIT
jgi:hypothetical protein